MKKLINSAFKHPLISGSSIVFIGSMATSVLNYFFNLGMGRLLTVSDYGIFASLMSIFNIFSVLSLTIMIVFTKFSASLVSKGERHLIKQLFRKGTLWVGELSFVICGAIILFSSQISSFLNINDLILVNITSATLFFAFLSSVGMGILQGVLKFVSLSVLNILSSFTKLVLGFGLVLIGLKVTGAMGAFFASSVFSYAFIFIAIRVISGGYFSHDIHIPNLHKSLSRYAIPVFLSTFGITAFITLDIILIKHFFKPEIAGQYAALSLMGRSIFYVVAPITTVLFPLMVQKKERKEKLFGTFILSVLLIGLPSIILSIIYFAIPGFVVNIFFPAQEYKNLASLMGPFSLFILFYSLSYLLSNFYLSIGKTKAFLFTIVGTFFEIIFIIFVHQTISQVVNGLTVISFLLLFSLLLYYRNATREA